MRLSLIFMATVYNCTSCSSANFAKLEYVFKKHVIFVFLFHLNVCLKQNGIDGIINLTLLHYYVFPG